MDVFIRTIFRIICLLLLAGLAFASAENPAIAKTDLSKSQNRDLIRMNEMFEGYPLPLDVKPSFEKADLPPEREALLKEYRDYAYLALLIDAGKYAKAEETFKRGRKFERAHWPYALSLLEVRMYLKEGKTADARGLCERLIASAPAAPRAVDAYMMLAEINRKDNNLDATIEALEGARKVAPLNRLVLENLGRRYGLKMQQAKAPQEQGELIGKLADVYETLLRVNPGQPSAPYLQVLSIISHQKGRSGQGHRVSGKGGPVDAGRDRGLCPARRPSAGEQRQGGGGRDPAAGFCERPRIPPFPRRFRRRWADRKPSGNSRSFTRGLPISIRAVTTFRLPTRGF